METMTTKMNRKLRRAMILFFCIFIVVVLIVVITMNIKSTKEQQSILEESVKAQLISTSIAAREMLDVDDFEAYDNEDVAQEPEYQETLRRLRHLAGEVGAEYIYALKQQGDEYVFVFDTDTEDESIFIPYELSPVHEAAFAGKESADVLNVEDDYGTFNTGAVPILKDGKVIGVVSTDIEDTFLLKSMQTAQRNTILLIVVMAVALGGMLAVVFWLMRRIGQMQKRMEVMAHYDQITGLPNRQYLLDVLENLASKGNDSPFALFFIDLDNFKSVNDNAGHEAGDDLLRHIASYLEGSHKNARSFRPAAGRLNIAARIGGDEFVQIITGIRTEAEAEASAQHLLDGFASHSKEIDRSIARYKVGMSIGIALFPYHSENHHVLIKYADAAMYQAKRAGKNRYCVYQDGMAVD